MTTSDVPAPIPVPVTEAPLKRRKTAATTPDMTPVQTSYAGCRFRSRLEARWAVFFDHLGIEWQYEPERYMVGPAPARRTYLPDFYLPDKAVWVEVKGHPEALDPMLMHAAADPQYGLPASPYGAAREYGLVEPRIALLGQVPRLAGAHGVVVVVAGEVLATQRGVFTCRAGNHQLTLVGTPGDDDPDGRMLDSVPFGLTPCDHVRAAYAAARSARFEHGESGAPRPDLPQIVAPSRPTRPRRKATAKTSAPSAAGTPVNYLPAPRRAGLTDSDLIPVALPREVEPPKRRARAPRQSHALPSPGPKETV